MADSVSGDKLSNILDNQTFDGLLAEAKLLSTNNYVHAEMQINDWGYSMVIRDSEPIDLETPDGDEYSLSIGAIITAGTGRTFDEMIQAANRGMKPRP